MTISRSSAEQLVASIQSEYSGHRTDAEGYLVDASGRRVIDRELGDPREGYAVFAKNWRRWSSDDVRNRVDQQSLVSLWAVADAGYYDLVCDILPGSYTGSNEGVLNYIRDISAGAGRSLPRNFAQYERMLRQGSAPAIVVSSAEEVSPAAAEGTSAEAGTALVNASVALDMGTGPALSQAVEAALAAIARAAQTRAVAA